MSWENFLEQLKREYCLKRHLLEINNEFQNLKKGNISIIKYATTFSNKVNLVSHLFPTKLSRMEKFANGLPVDCGLNVKLVTTLKSAICATKNVEIQFKEKIWKRLELERKKGLKGLQSLIIQDYFPNLAPMIRSQRMTKG